MMMAIPELSPLETVAALFASHQAEVISEWRAHANELLEDLNLDTPRLTDHMPVIVAEIISELCRGRSNDAGKQVREMPPAHGVQRYYDGLDVGEVVAEYNLLRMAFITVAERHGVYLVGSAIRIINHRIDIAVRQSVVAFAERQALMRKEKEDEHLAFVAHDLRTPLNAVSLVVEEMKYGLDSKALVEAADLFETLQRNLHSVELLIKRVLDTRLHETPADTTFRPERRLFELWPLVQRLITDLRPLASSQDIEVVNEVPRTLTVFADAALVTQVFQNLLGNAFKYAPGGRVVVSARTEAGMVSCAVRDSGAGIAPDLLGRIFEKGTTDPMKEGTGLGLVIVKQIVEAHGGTVKAESISGQGATLTFTLPETMAG